MNNNNNDLSLQRTKYQEDLINTDDQNQEADPDFLYHPDYSTACIYLLPKPHHQRQLHRHSRPYFPPVHHHRSSPPLSASSSATKHSPFTSISTYFGSNPFHDNLYNSLRPFQPHHSNTHTVLAASPKGDFLPVCLLLNPTQQGNLYYALKDYLSSRGYWFPLSLSCGTHLHDEVDHVVIPNSGVSYRWLSYWLTCWCRRRWMMLKRKFEQDFNSG